MTETVKISFNISSDLLSKIDNYAESLHINRTSAMSVLMSQALVQNEGIDALKTMSDLMAKMDVNKLQAEPKK